MPPASSSKGAWLGAVSRAYTVAVSFALLLLLYQQHGMPGHGGGGAGSSSGPGLRVEVQSDAAAAAAALEGRRVEAPRRLAEGVMQRQHQLRQQVAPDGVSMLTPQLDLSLMMGWDHALSSVSTLAWMAYKCFPPLAETYHGGELGPVRDKMRGALVRAMAALKGVPEQDIDVAAPFPAALGVEDLRVPLVADWRSAMSRVLAGYFLDGRWKREGHRFCCNPAKGKAAGLEHMGELDCAPAGPGGKAEDPLECAGIGTGVMMAAWSINATVQNVLAEGLCTDPPAYTRGLANVLVQERMLSEEWHTFNTPDLHSDAAVFQFQLMYEHLEMFRRQRWLGVIALQNPMDAWSIQDIISSTRPALIVETGTANGGSALLWASVLELNQLNGSRVVTIDPNDPADAEGMLQGADGRQGARAEESWLWSKYVTFVQGRSLDRHVLAQVARLVERSVGGPVLVILDSDHAEEHVYQEASKYCALVSVGSYCIIQDTKMSRFGWTGPLPAVRRFVADHANFQPDRERELLFTDHSFGYLKRLS